MLIEFNVRNYLSIKDQVTFSMVASPIKELKETNTFPLANFNLLKSSVIYGANASGKSNLFKAMSFMRKVVLNSSKETQVEEEISVDKFRLSTETENQPSEFEVVFSHEDYRYRYGFEVDREKVHSEWLYRAKTGKEANLFTRIDNAIKVGGYFKEGKGLEDRTRDNALFLSVVGQFNGSISRKILSWFNNFNVISTDRNSLGYTKKMLNEPNIKKSILDLMKIADLSIDDISTEKINIEEMVFPDDMPPALKKLISKDLQLIFTHHKKYDEDNNFSSMELFNLEQNESQGTIKFFALAAPILDTLLNGKILLIDELDAKLHPLLTRTIIQLFNSNETNQSNAQLVFTTHDTTHLSKNIFRRDQIWFVEKDRYGCSDLYSLIEYTIEEEKIRNDASFEKDYISGKYGAIPYIGRIEFLEEKDGE